MNKQTIPLFNLPVRDTTEEIYRQQHVYQALFIPSDFPIPWATVRRPGNFILDDTDNP
jgi:hypothetical protein